MDLKNRAAPPLPPSTRNAQAIERSQSDRSATATRAQAILSRSQSSAMAVQLGSAAERLKNLEPKKIADALAHASLYVRQPILSDVNASNVNKFNIVRALAELLAKKDEMQPFQSVSAGMASLVGIDLTGTSTSMPTALQEIIVNVFVTYLVDKDEAHVPMAVEMLSQMGLRNNVALRLLDWIDQNCQNPGVYRALRALKLIDLATPEVIVKILSAMHHFSPSSFVRLDSGTPEPSCLDSSAEILSQFPDIAFNMKVLETIDNLLKTPPVYATKNHAPTQRRKYISALLGLLETKFAPRIKKFQYSQQTAQVRKSQVLEARAMSGLDPFGAGEFVEEERNPTSDLYASVLSTVQDYLSDHELTIRKAASRFIRGVSTSSVYCKVIAQQVAWWLQSDKAADQRTALTDMVALSFPGSVLLDTILELLEHEDSRTVHAAITCLHHHIVEKEHHHETPNDFLDMINNIKEHISEVFAELMLSDLRTPTLDMFTEDTESDTTKTSAFRLLFHARHLTHPAVCNAVMALESSSDALVEASLQYLVMAALLSDNPITRTPAISALSGFMKDSKVATSLKLILITLAQDLKQRVVSFDLIQQATILLTDPQQTVREAAAAMFQAYFEIEAAKGTQNGDNTHSLQHILLEMFRSELVNGESVNAKLVALQSLAQLKIANSLLEYILISLIDHHDTAIKIAAFAALTALHIHAVQAVNKARKYLHVSNEALRDAASVFAFTACALELRRHGAPLHDNEIVNTAIWCLAKDQRDHDTLGDLRQAALLLLREIAKNKIDESSLEDGNVQTDELNLKECLFAYLQNLAKRDSVKIQRLAWRFYIEYFILEAADYQLLAEAYRSSRVPSARSRATYDRDVMVDTLAMVEVRSAEDMLILLQASVRDEIMAYLHANSMLTYACSPHREYQEGWSPLIADLRKSAPIVGVLVTVAFRNLPRVIEQPIIPEELAATVPAKSRPVSLSFPQHFVVDDIIAPRSADQPSRIGARPSAQQAGAVTPPSSQEATQAVGRVLSLEKKLQHEAERYVVSQKAFRDEKRARLLVEEKCRELMTEMKKLRTKYDAKVRQINDLKENPSSGSAKQLPAVPGKKSSSASAISEKTHTASTSSAALAVSSSVQRSLSMPAQGAAASTRGKWDRGRPASLMTMIESTDADNDDMHADDEATPDATFSSPISAENAQPSSQAPSSLSTTDASAAADARSDSGAGSSAVSVISPSASGNAEASSSPSAHSTGLQRSHSTSSTGPQSSPKKTKFGFGSFLKKNKPVLNTEESNARILSGSESASEDDENADARHASRSSHPSPAKPLISGPLAVVDAPPLLPHQDSNSHVKEEVRRLEAARIEAATSLRKIWGKPQRTGSVRGILQELNATEDYVASSSEDEEDGADVKAKLEQQRMALIQIEQIRMELERLDAESDEENEKNGTESKAKDETTTSAAQPSPAAAIPPAAATPTEEAKTSKRAGGVLVLPPAQALTRSVSLPKSSQAPTVTASNRHSVAPNVLLNSSSVASSSQPPEQPATSAAALLVAANGSSSASAAASPQAPEAPSTVSADAAEAASATPAPSALTPGSAADKQGTPSQWKLRAASSIRRSNSSASNRRVTFVGSDSENDDFTLPEVEFDQNAPSTQHQQQQEEISAASSPRAAIEPSSDTESESAPEFHDASESLDAKDGGHAVTTVNSGTQSSAPASASIATTQVTQPATTTSSVSHSTSATVTHSTSATVTQHNVDSPRVLHEDSPNIDADQASASNSTVTSPTTTVSQPVRKLLGRRKLPDPKAAIYDTLLREEQAYIARMQLAASYINGPLRSFESSHLLEKGDYPIARFMAIHERIVALHVMLLRGLFEVMSEMPIVLPDMVAVAHLFRDYEHFFHVYTRYQPMYYMFLQILAKHEEKHAVAFTSLRDNSIKAALQAAQTENNAGQGLGMDVGSWYREPLSRVLTIKTCFDKLLKFATNDTQAAAVRTVVTFLHEIQQQMSEGPAFDAQQDEYKRLVSKKFKSSCPTLFSPVRLFLKRWVFHEIKTKKGAVAKTDEDASDALDTSDSKSTFGDIYESDDESLNSSTSSARFSKPAKAGTEVKVYLFNDSLLIAGKKLGYATCKAFASLHDVTVIDSSPHVAMLGLKVVIKGREECHVYQAVSLEEKKEFIRALKVENCIMNGKISTA